MHQGRRFLAVIPARGGSRGIPGKNIALLGGRPLLAHTMDHAAGVAEFDRIVVSTDDAAIAAVAEATGVSVIRRPAELSTDTASTELALLHALDTLAAQGEPPFDYVAVLEPTAPFRRVETVRAAIHDIVARNAISLLTVCAVHESMGRLEDGMFRPFQKARRRQDREPLYVECGTIYLCRVDHLRTTGSLVAENWLSVVVDKKEAIDINEPIDLAIAEVLMRQAFAQEETK